MIHVEVHKNGQDRITLENEHVRAVFLPARGGKMAELTSLATGRQFLRESQTPAPQLAQYGDDFVRVAPAGFDECFPTVAPSAYRPPGHTGDPLQLPDHGELWSRPWHYEVKGGALRFSIDGVLLAYRFEKEVSLAGKGLRMRYSVRNWERFSFAYLWSAHPLLKGTTPARLLLPPDVEHVLLEWSSDPRLGRPGDRLPWPVLTLDARRDYSFVQPPDLGQALKCFTPALEQGAAGVHYLDTDERLHLRFDPGVTPYLGLWLCYGGWPEDTREKHYTIALEPTNGRRDALEAAMAHGECPVIGPGRTHTWTLELDLQNHTTTP